MFNFEEDFGIDVFNEQVMKDMLDRETYKALKTTIDDGKDLQLDIANNVALAMKNWALSRGATHYTHWFQPLTGITAEKHDSFLSGENEGKAILDFSGKELIKGESDASSFPSGGLRSTFEARGYTAWDPTSYAFVRNGTLYIPTAFCSYGGEALDTKTPLLRSMKCLNEVAKRILHYFGNDEVKMVSSQVGAEQEYFLIDKRMFARRPDLIYTGRTLFGVMPPKGQELDDHYYGTINMRVSDYMSDVDKELWKLGILAKTKHNEVAPAQHEIACVYTKVNVANDNNQLLMDIMKKVAIRHGLVCLFHEKPFAGVNGSGKHNNWSIATDTGINLLAPGDTPSENMQFLFFLVAVIKSVYKHQDLLRISVATASNDHRLGANEAPPAVLSMFLGEELTEILKNVENGKSSKNAKVRNVQLGVDVLPNFRCDTTDRNRTSPFAFTGNKFEFRMLGSSNTIADANIAINTIMADTLSEFADRLDKANDKNEEIQNIIKDTIKECKNIIFNGNGYDDKWIEEATKNRGLVNYKTTVDAVKHLLDKKNIEVFEKNGIYTKTELEARYTIILENYIKNINIEARTMINMVSKRILPASEKYVDFLSKTVTDKKNALGLVATPFEKDTLENVISLQNDLYDKYKILLNDANEMSNITDITTHAEYMKDNILPAMESVRKASDKLENVTAKEYWPIPSYADIFSSVN